MISLNWVKSHHFQGWNFLLLTIPDVNSIKICKNVGIGLHLYLHVGENMPFKTTPKHYRKLKEKKSPCIVSKACAFLIVKSWVLHWAMRGRYLNMRCIVRYRRYRYAVILFDYLFTSFSFLTSRNCTSVLHEVAITFSSFATPEFRKLYSWYGFVINHGPWWSIRSAIIHE